MPTVDELLNASNEVTTCTINPNTREITVPEKYKILGVFSDEKVTKIPFTCPRVVGNNVDLTEYNLYINYENAIGKSNAYLIEDVAVSGDNITFSWLLSRNVTVSPGVVKYSFCAKKLDGDTISNEWNTTIANGLVIQGLEATREIIEENPDIIETLLTKSHVHINKSVLDKFAEIEGKPTYNGEALGGGASTAEDIAYTNSKVPSSQQEYGVKGALDYLLSYTPHTHYNTLALDKLSTDKANSTALFINGRSNKIALEPKIFNYASYTSEILNLTNNSYYILRQVHKLTINPPSTPTVAADTIWITFADEGDIELSFPTTVKYIGKIPTVNNGETWEITIINNVVSIQKVGEGV
jgi:hypothetical protein